MTDDLFFYFCGLVLVGFIWGSTNPLMKKRTTNIKKIHSRTFLGRLFADLYCIFTNYKFILTFIVNQSGSLLFFLLLRQTDISLAVPVANSLAFVFTALTGWYLGEQMPKLDGLLGILFIITGVSLCVYDKALQKEQ